LWMRWWTFGFWRHGITELVIWSVISFWITNFVSNRVSCCVCHCFSFAIWNFNSYSDVLRFSLCIDSVIKLSFCCCYLFIYRKKCFDLFVFFSCILSESISFMLYIK
jgi:hypothetical protein